jgi:hypothetical protein
MLKRLFFVWIFTLITCNSLINAQERVIFYEHINFQGESFVLTAGKEMNNLTEVKDSAGKHWSDRISSIKIEGDLEVIIWDDINFFDEPKNDVAIVKSSTVNLAERPNPSYDWSDTISCICVVRKGNAEQHLKDHK